MIISSIFRKNRGLKKTRYIQLGRNFDHRFLKRLKIVDFGGSRPRKIILTKFRSKNFHTTKTFLNSRHFTARFQNNRSHIFVSDFNFFGQITAKIRLLKSAKILSEQMTTEIWKTRCEARFVGSIQALKAICLFRKRAVKCRWGGFRTNFLVCESFYIQSL